MSMWTNPTKGWAEAIDFLERVKAEILPPDKVVTGPLYEHEQALLKVIAKNITFEKKTSDPDVLNDCRRETFLAFEINNLETSKMLLEKMRDYERILAAGHSKSIEDLWEVVEKKVRDEWRLSNNSERMLSASTQRDLVLHRNAFRAFIELKNIGDRISPEKQFKVLCQSVFDVLCNKPQAFPAVTASWPREDVVIARKSITAIRDSWKKSGQKLLPG